MSNISCIVKSARRIMRQDIGTGSDELLKFVDQTLFPTLGNLDLSTGNKRAVLVHEVFANNYNYMKSGIHLRQVINKLNEIDFNNSKDKHVFGQIYESFLGDLQSAGTLGEFYTPRAITELLVELTDPQAWQVDIETIKANGYNLDIKNPHQPE
jgi:type I restriction enzyme M protein